MKKLIKENIKFIIFLIILILLFNVRLPYYISVGGGIININNRIELEDEDIKNEEGSLNMLYVTEYEATIPTYLLSYIIKDWDLEKVSDAGLDNEDTKDIYNRNKVMLDNSIQNATFVAFNKANKKIDIKGYNNYVIALTLDNGLKVGDKIIKANDKEIENMNDLKEIVKETEVGEYINLTIERNNKQQELKVKVQKDEENNQKLIGIALITNYEYETDPKIKLNFKKNESGSSGGLMLSLSIYNAISDIDIIKGRKIAGTGTIDEDGNVGEIDGIKYKIMGAYKNKMEIVLVPKANYEEAVKVNEEKNYNLTIVSVSTFDDAIEYLENN